MLTEMLNVLVAPIMLLVCILCGVLIGWTAYRSGRRDSDDIMLRLKCMDNVGSDSPPIRVFDGSDEELPPSCAQGFDTCRD